MSGTIGERLISEGVISAAQLAQAMVRQKQEGGDLGQALMGLGFLASCQLRQFFETVPQVPVKIADTGLSEAFLTDLLLKAAYMESGAFTLQPLATTLS
ncbi:MAG TPA: ATPase, partial [Nitrosospira sp.]|nr:ATPase [Nitrosospira sp.]